MRFIKLASFSLVCSLLFCGILVAQETEDSSGDPPTTEELIEREKKLLDSLTKEFKEYNAQLQAVNKTRFPEEKNFVLEVVVEVQEERIPKNAVDAAWLWVRKKRPNTDYPFVYFERILRLEGERLGFEVPPFDREIYSRFRFNNGGFNRTTNGIR